MKKILTIFIAFFFGMNVNAQDEVYVHAVMQVTPKKY